MTRRKLFKSLFCIAGAMVLPVKEAKPEVQTITLKLDSRGFADEVKKVLDQHRVVTAHQFSADRMVRSVRRMARG